MAVYEIDGKRYQSDTPLTDAELEELSGKATPSMGAVIAESARKVWQVVLALLLVFQTCSFLH